MKRFTPLPDHELVPAVDHNIVHLCDQGFWWCRVCNKITNLQTEQDQVDPGDEYSGCCFCGSRNLKWHPPVFEQQEKERRSA